MLFELYNRYDQKGFSLTLDGRGRKSHGYPKVSLRNIFRVRIALSWFQRWGWDKKTQKGAHIPGGLFQIDFGNGSGYVYGRTFFLGFNVKGGGSEYRYLPAKFRLGFTQNANLVPYGFCA